MFPDLDIYTFTFFPCEANVEDIKSLTKLSKTFKTIHKNIYKNVTFIDIKNSLEFFYSKSKTLI
jgi:anionic cell wall polymer biosynthesis LytR-Cps2A-Psr (LCP) family protein